VNRKFQLIVIGGGLRRSMLAILFDVLAMLPESSSFMLLDSGLIAFAAAIKRDAARDSWLKSDESRVISIAVSTLSFE